ncbi:somatostatin-1B-like isoform X1 [Melospiza georgiana]|uniref:somatostatin-1B-like isoform X1 n=1 Tax=Melospiza georgiana TaxID=44398 RepID=UPI0025AC3A76|nr:somatostatin-1B-like isoform X1 [Melospiza georgiana]
MGDSSGLCSHRSLSSSTALPSLGSEMRQGNEKGPRGERSTVHKDVILKMLAGLLDGVDAGSEAALPDGEEEEGKLQGERAALGRLAQLPQRDRKAPCKNFFWKTFTSC